MEGKFLLPLKAQESSFKHSAIQLFVFKYNAKKLQMALYCDAVELKHPHLRYIYILVPSNTERPKELSCD